MASPSRARALSLLALLLALLCAAAQGARNLQVCIRRITRRLPACVRGALACRLAAGAAIPRALGAAHVARWGWALTDAHMRRCVRVWSCSACGALVCSPFARSRSNRHAECAPRAATSAVPGTRKCALRHRVPISDAPWRAARKAFAAAAAGRTCASRSASTRRVRGPCCLWWMLGCVQVLFDGASVRRRRATLLHEQRQFAHVLQPQVRGEVAALLSSAPGRRSPVPCWRRTDASYALARVCRLLRQLPTLPRRRGREELFSCPGLCCARVRTSHKGDYMPLVSADAAAPRVGSVVSRGSVRSRAAAFSLFKSGQYLPRRRCLFACMLDFRVHSSSSEPPATPAASAATGSAFMS